MGSEGTNLRDWKVEYKCLLPVVIREIQDMKEVMILPRRIRTKMSKARE